MALVLEKIDRQGVVTRQPIEVGRNHVAATPGLHYRIVDDASLNPPAIHATAKRVGNDLIIDDLPDQKLVQFDNFFTACTADQSCAVSMDGLGGATGAEVTPTTTPVAALTDGTFVMFSSEASVTSAVTPLAAATDTSGSVGFKGVALGLLGLGLLGAAAGGGGGGGGGGGSGSGPTAPTQQIAITNPSLTKDGDPVLTGTATPGDRLAITVSGNGLNIVYNVTTDANGNWTLDTSTAAPLTSTRIPAGGLPDGSYSVTVHSATAGVSDAVQTLAIDHTAPAAPAVGAVTGDNTINASEAATGVTIAGSAEAGSTVSVNWGGVVHTATAAANGGWSVTFSHGEIPANGSTQVVASATDAAGNTSSSASLTVLVDTVAPAAPSVQSASITNSTHPVINGFAEAGSAVTVALDLNRDGSPDATYRTTANSSGIWSIDTATAAPISGALPGGQIPNGTVSTVSVSATDAAGNTSPLTNASLTIDTSIPPAPMINAVTGDNAVNHAEAAGTVTITGTLSIANRPVTVTWTDTGGHVLSTSATVSGTTWSASFSSAQVGTLDQGPTNVHATYTNAAGSTSAEGTQPVTVDTLVPTPPTTPPSIPEASGGLNANEAGDGTTVAVNVAATGAAAGDTLIVHWGTATVTHALTAAEISGGTVNVTVPAATITATGDGTVQVTASITDAAGNVGPSSAATAVLVDTHAPTVTISDSATGATTNAVDTFTFTFSEAVTGFTAADVSVVGGSAANFHQVDSTHYAIDVTPSAGTTGTMTVSVAAGAFNDGAGNPNATGATLSQNFDTQPPSLTITDTITAASTNQTDTFIFTFSEAVTGFTAGDISVSGGSASNFHQVSSTEYQIDVTPTANSSGTMMVSVAPGAFTDAAGNANTAGASASQNYSTQGPSVTISDSVTAATTNQVDTFTFAFSSAVTGFTLSDITVSGGVAGNFQTIDSSHYSVDVTPTNGVQSGTMSVSLAAGVASDSSGNGNTAGAAVTQAYDTQAPTVAITDSITAATTGQPDTFTFAFSEPVTGFTASSITVAGGTGSNFHQVDSTHYAIDVTPTAGTTGVMSVTVAAGAFTDAAGNASTAGASASQSFDTTAPTVTIADSVSAAVTNTDDTFAFTFSKPVTGFTQSDITVAGGTLSSFQTIDGSHYSVTVTPTPSSASGTMSVSLAAGVATDSSGNGNAAGGAVTQAYDTLAPTETLSSTANGDSSVTLTLSHVLDNGATTAESIAVTRVDETGPTSSTTVTWANPGSATYTDASTVAGHTYTYSATITDLAGNATHLQTNAVT